MVQPCQVNLMSCFFSAQASQNNVSRAVGLPDSTDVALPATTKQVVHIHDPRGVFGPLQCIETACLPDRWAMFVWGFLKQYCPRSTLGKLSSWLPHLSCTVVYKLIVSSVFWTKGAATGHVTRLVYTSRAEENNGKLTTTHNTAKGFITLLQQHKCNFIFLTM